MEDKQIILSRLLPKTGQIISYCSDDDGDIQAGWWRGRDSTNNKVRFISKTINGDVVVIDRATGLMWAADGNAVGCNNGNASIWSNACSYAAALTFAGFSDWRLPNVKELCSIVNYSLRLSAIDEPPFSNTLERVYWSGTTVENGGINAWYVAFLDGQCRFLLKTDSLYLRCVRGGL